MDFSVEIGRRPEVAYTIHPSSRALLTAVRVKRWRAYKGPPIPIRYSRGFFAWSRLSFWFRKGKAPPVIRPNGAIGDLQWQR